MYQEERILKIQQLLAKKGRVTKKEIMEIFSVSSDTARRDILEVLKTDKVVRTHGGIMLAAASSQVFDFFERTHMSKPEKERMATLVQNHLPEGSLCFLDVSTTLLLVAQRLEKFCTIYTHSLDNAFALANKHQINTHLLGGKLDSENRFFFSEESLEMISQLKFDYCVIGAASLEKEGIFFKEQHNALIKRKVIEQSRHVILVAENQKFSKLGHFKGADYHQINQFITDKAMTNTQQAYFKPDIEVIYEEE
uniref:DeoR/GlpR family DNA-binding transcription regulator n=1 Tax=Candidatus Enterococcus willemsii TaxID=1857215 RepID=UPI00403FACCE